MRKYIVFVLALGLFSSCHIGRFFVYNFANISDHKKFKDADIGEASAPYFFEQSDNELPVISVQNEIRSTEDLDAFNAEHKTVAFLIIKGDSVHHEWYADKVDSSSVLTSFSMSKSYVSALVGIAIEEGFIKSINDPITDYIKTFKNEGFEKITIEHVLNMRTGIDYKENYYSPFGNVAIGYYGRHLDRHLAKLKVKSGPDERFDYVSIATQILGQVVANATGKSVSKYCEEKIWKKIGTEYGATWSLDRKGGMEKAFCCLNARARDYAKFGKLYLNDGKWGEEQVIPSSWVEASVKKSNKSKDSFYAYQWWHMPEQENGKLRKDIDFYMQGHLGQYVYMDPDNDVIIVRLGKNRDNVYWDGLLRDIADNI